MNIHPPIAGAYADGRHPSKSRKAAATGPAGFVPCRPILDLTFEPTGSRIADSLLTRSAAHLAGLSRAAQLDWFEEWMPALEGNPPEGVNAFQQAMALATLGKWQVSILEGA